jgi:hypothetical protein
MPCELRCLNYGAQAVLWKRVMPKLLKSVTFTQQTGGMRVFNILLLTNIYFRIELCILLL